MRLTAHPVHDGGGYLDIRPAARRRAWMDGTTKGFANRCLPLLIANQAGWDFVLPGPLTATWDGGTHTSAVRFECSGDWGDRSRLVSSVFGYGILTFHTGLLFRCDPGYLLWVRGPANHPIDGATALEGIVEADWLPFTFTMNWALTRPGLTVRFEAGAPVCRVLPLPAALFDEVDPVLEPMPAGLRRRYDAWTESRAAFQRGEGDPAATRRGWQRDYFQGRAGPSSTEIADGHATKLHVRPFRGDEP